MGTLRRLLLLLAGLLLVAWLILIAWAWWPRGVDTQPARALAGPDDRFVQVEGLELRYRSWGQPAPGRPTVLLIHGFANSLQSFRLLAPALADEFHVIALDLPGFGLSSKPSGHDYSNAGQARMVGAFMRALALDRVIVAGHSLGGNVALHVATSEPAASGLVLMNPGIITTGVPAITQYLFFPLQRLNARMFGDRSFRSSFLARSYVDPAIITDEVIDELMLAARTDDYMSGMTSIMRQYSAPGAELPLLEQVRVPVLIVWGEADASKPPGELDELAALLPGAGVARVPGVGHYVHEEAPAATAAAIRAHFAQHERTD